MESMGFAELRPDLAADGLLPMSLTDLGKRLAHEKCVPEGFLNFALSESFGNAGKYELRIISMREQQFRSDLARGILAGRTNRNCARGPQSRLLSFASLPAMAA
jgi:hypothetical protein